jgi:hypothetical protein
MSAFSSYRPHNHRISTDQQNAFYSLITDRISNISPTTKYVNLNDNTYNPSQDNRGNPDLWTSYVIDTNDYFNEMSTLSKTICNIFNVEIMNSPNTRYVVFTNLQTNQRHLIYKTLSNLGIKFSKQYDLNNCPQISINIKLFCWVIPSNVHYIDNTRREILTNFYANLNTNNGMDEFGNIYVTMQDFITLKKIVNRVVFRAGSLNLHDDPIVYRLPIPPPNTDFTCAAGSSLSRLTTKKIELSDLIFDIKESIPDIMFKEMMETLAQI